MSAYLRPAGLNDALGRLSAEPHRIIAGGTDVFPAAAAAVGWGRPGIDHPGRAPILDITAIEALSHIRRFPDRVEIGALVTWTEAIESDLPAWFDGVRQAAREVGGRQIQNRGTLAGNLCNASPAADGVPALLALDARVRLRRRGGSRDVPLESFITGNRRTCLRPEELMTTIVIPSPAPGARSTFLKLGARRYLVISIAMVAAGLEVRDGRIRGARIAVGACSEVARRLTRLEARLEGTRPEDAPGGVREEDFASLSPLNDVRASAAYRRHGARVLVTRALGALVHGEGAAR
ncbi:MAG: FAD binding domain-containing protein [Thiotrichales bacterium]|nr:FAD binding domain-containing protein [Thiotrichales bacterium]